MSLLFGDRVPEERAGSRIVERRGPMINVARRFSTFVPGKFPATSARRSRYRRVAGFQLVCFAGLSIGLSACASNTDKELAFPDQPSPPAVVESADPPTPADLSSPPVAKTQARARRDEHRIHKVAKSPEKPANPPERLAVVEPHELIGQGPSGVAKLLGVPSSASQRDVSLIWTYSSTGCAFQVYFYPDIRTSLWHALQYTSVDKNGGVLAPSQLCIQRILTERGNGAG